MVRLWPTFPAQPSTVAACVWRALGNSEPRGSCFSLALRQVRCHADLVSCTELAKVLYAEASLAARNHRRDRWFAWCSEQDNRGRLFRWVRAPAATPVALNTPVKVETLETQLQDAHAWWTPALGPHCGRASRPRALRLVPRRPAVVPAYATPMWR